MSKNKIVSPLAYKVMLKEVHHNMYLARKFTALEKVKSFANKKGYIVEIVRTKNNNWNQYIKMNVHASKQTKVSTTEALDMRSRISFILNQNLPSDLNIHFEEFNRPEDQGKFLIFKLFNQ